MDPYFINFMRYALFIYNIILAITGIILITGGAIVLKTQEVLDSQLSGSTTASAVVFIFAGVLIFIVSVVGCWGVLRESYITLLAYGALLALLFIALAAVGLTAAVARDTVSEDVKSDLEDSLRAYNKKSSCRRFWDNIQNKYECCGIDQASDWNGEIESERLFDSTAAPSSTAPSPPSNSENPPESKTDTDTIPASCCPGSVLECKSYISYPAGCFDKVYNNRKEAWTILMGIGIGIATFLIIGMILTFWLAIELMRECDDENNYE